MSETPADRRYRERLALNDVLARAEERTAERLRQEATPHATRYAWCFSHGRLHRFQVTDVPWCTADWIWLDGGQEADALADKRRRFGHAQFLHHLPDDQQLAILRDHASRYDQKEQS